MNANADRVESLLSQATTLLDESRALNYALVMMLARTPRQKLSKEKIDALCQLAYEVLNNINETHDIIQRARHELLDTEAPPTAL